MEEHRGDYAGLAACAVSHVNHFQLRFRAMPGGILGILIVIATTLATRPVLAAEVQYKNPRFDGYALDYCRNWAVECGKPAADAYCHKKGYKRATQFRVKKDSPPTRVIGSGKVCTAPSCDRIAWVACAADGVYRNPMVGGYALDYCRTWGSGCGKPAADAFCRRKGHVRSVDYAVRKDTPPTRVIGTRQTCNDPRCDRIVSVTCAGTGAKQGGDAWLDEGKMDAAGDAIMVTEDEDESIIFDDQTPYH